MFQNGGVILALIRRHHDGMYKQIAPAQTAVVSGEEDGEAGVEVGSLFD